MAISIVGSASSTSGVDGTTETLSHTVPAGSNRLLFVGIGLSAGTPGNVSGVTFNGDPMTQAWNSLFGVTRSFGYYLVAPDETTANIEVTFTGGVDEFAFGAVNFAGVDQGTPIGTPATGGTDTGTATVDVTSVANDVVIDCVHAVATSITVGAGQSSSSPGGWEVDNNSGTSSGSSTETASGASTTMSWTLSAANDWAIGGVALKPAADAPAANDIPSSGNFGPGISQKPPHMIPSGAF